MKKSLILIPLILSAALCFSMGIAAEKPNIILIVTDDQGNADAGFRDPAVHTPNLDKLVASGVELKRFHTAPVCSPTRAGLMTGLYPIRLGMQRAVNRPFSKIGLPEELTTLPEALGEAGYRERHIVGKWHLGKMRKAQLRMNHGFTHQYGPYCGGIDYFKHTRLKVHDFHRNQETIKEDGYYTDLLSDEAVRIIDGHEGADPFFIYLAHGAPRTPLQAPAKEIERYKHLAEERAAYLVMITVIDQGLGRNLEAKLILYDLAKDISEETHLAAQHPKLVDEFLEKLVAFRKLRPEGGVPPMIEPEPKGWKPFPNWERVD